MRIIPIAVAAAIFSVPTFGVAATVSPAAHGIKSESTFHLVKAKKKKGKKSAAARAGHCGTGKYFKGGKCMSAADKKKAS